MLMMVFVLPLALMAQTRPSPAKKPLTMQKEDKTVNYLEMVVLEESIGKKGSKEIKTTYSFNCTNKRIDDMLTEKSPKFETVIHALNYLSGMGWELVSVSENKYYLKNTKRKPPVKR